MIAVGLQPMTTDKVLEYIGIIAGITSVWFSRKEHILVYPVGLVNTIIYIYLSLKGSLFGEASVNLYYTIMSIYGWYLWSKKDQQHHVILHIARSGKKDWINQILFFLVCYAALFSGISFLANYFSDAIPWADAFASASAFTGMWLMARKKLENWYWWIVTNLASIPLYYVKGYRETAGYFIILLIMACFGLAEWNRRLKENSGKQAFNSTTA